MSRKKQPALYVMVSCMPCFYLVLVFGIDLVSKETLGEKKKPMKQQSKL
jgi:hypothetical protein